MGTRNLIINMKVTLAIFAALVAVAIAAPIVNHDIIAAVNNDESSTWTAGVNKAFEGMSVEQMKALLNVQVTKEQPIGLVGPDAAKTMQEEADRVAPVFVRGCQGSPRVRHSPLAERHREPGALRL